MKTRRTRTESRVGHSTIEPGRLTPRKPDLCGYTHFEGSGVYAAAPAPDRLDLDQLGELENYYDDELAGIRENLIDDIAHIEQENRVIDGRIEEFNRRKQELAHDRAERSKAIRAVKPPGSHEPSECATSPRRRGSFLPTRGGVRLWGDGDR